VGHRPRLAVADLEHEEARSRRPRDERVESRAEEGLLGLEAELRLQAFDRLRVADDAGRIAAWLEGVAAASLAQSA